MTNSDLIWKLVEQLLKKDNKQDKTNNQSKENDD